LFKEAIKQFVRHTVGMHTLSLYNRHRFPAEIISHSVWLYFRFALSFRDVEEMLAMRGVTLSNETAREWCLKFGQNYATACVTSLLVPATSGTWMRFS
jgi:putative transposase